MSVSEDDGSDKQNRPIVTHGRLKDAFTQNGTHGRLKEAFTQNMVHMVI